MIKLFFIFLLLIIPNISFASYFAEGISAYKNKNFQKAITLFQKSIEDENSQQAHFFLGLIYLENKKRDLAKAKLHLKKAVDFGNARAKCFLAKALLLEKKSDKKRVITLLKEGKKSGAEECITIASIYKLPI